jgi:hypothetical protein
LVLVVVIAAATPALLNAALSAVSRTGTTTTVDYSAYISDLYSKYSSLANAYSTLASRLDSLDLSLGSLNLSYAAFKGYATPLLRWLESVNTTETASYIVFVGDDGKYYAKNGSTGMIEFSGSDAGAVITSAINAMPRGGLIFIKAGTYYLSTPIVINKPVAIHGEGAGWFGVKRTELRPAQGIDAIVIDGGTQNIYMGEIVDIEIYGDGLGKGQRGIHIVKYASDWLIERVSIHRVDEGITIEANGTNVWNIWIINNWIEMNGYGVRLTNAPNGIDEIHIHKNKFFGNKYASVSVEHPYVTRVWITENVFNRDKRDGVVISAGRFFYIAGNWFNDEGTEQANTYDGIKIVGGYGDVVIMGNFFRAVDYMRYGVYIAPGTSPRILILGNLFRGLKTAPIYNGLASAGYIIRDNMGYRTDSFKYTGLSIPIGVNDTYGPAREILTPSGVITNFRARITWGGTFGSGETVTVKIRVAYDDLSVAYIEKSATAPGSTWLTDEDIMSLVAHNKAIIKMDIYAKTNLASTTATVSVDLYGTG